MAREKKQPESDEAPGAPDWMVTYSDCMTLLLTFFVLLMTFSSFDERIFRELRVIYCDAFTSVFPGRKAAKDACLLVEPVINKTEVEKGSEKPTLEKGK